MPADGETRAAVLDRKTPAVVPCPPYRGRAPTAEAPGLLGAVPLLAVPLKHLQLVTRRDKPAGLDREEDGGENRPGGKCQQRTPPTRVALAKGSPVDLPVDEVPNVKSEHATAPSALTVWFYFGQIDPYPPAELPSSSTGLGLDGQ
jgi:hypothetical protein